MDAGPREYIAKEGEIVPNKRWIAWTLIAATGCAMPNIPGLPLRWSQKPQQSSQMAAAQAPATGQNPSFTQRVISFLHIPGAKPPQPNAAAQAAQQKTQQKHDPISLGFASGPPTPELYLSMAEMSDRGGNAEHARSMYQRALSMEPNHLDALLGLARLEDREGRMDVALKTYQQAVALHPQNAKALNDLALCYARNGQLPASLKLLDQAVKLQPDKALYRNNIAKVLVEVNRVDEAKSHLSAVHPPAIAHYNMGVLLQQRGRTQEAIRYLTAAVHIDPQLQAARKLLVELQGDAPLLASNDGVLPTPLAQSNFLAGTVPAGGLAAQRTQPQSFPAETAQVPLGHSPMSLPPVR
jgi:tetratricopeptide (TPR) repeat protein